jgi:transposase
MKTHLLPVGPIKIIRDAARAVKGTAGLMVKRVTAGTLSELLGLPGMVVTEYALEQQDDGREILHIFCHHAHEIAQCSGCGQVSQDLHEEAERSIRHLDIWGKITYVHFPSRRFDCQQCKKPFTEGLSWIEAKRRESSSYEVYVYEQCKSTDIEAVAERERLHPETVRLIFKRWAKRAEKKQVRQLVRCLGIDEISLRKGQQHFVMVLTDLERHYVVAILEERSQKALETWLAGLSEAERKAMRLVAMDMWGPYRGVIKAKLPQAEIVADRFHVMKHLNHAIAKIRCKLQAKSDKAGYELLKGLRWILVRNRDDLKPEEELKLQAALSAFPELRTAYLLKERFVTIANRIHDRSQAERFLHAWVYEAQASGLAQLLKFTQTLSNWWNEFLNYFNEGFTSAVVEGLNNAIRGIIRRAFGYLAFENFRLHVLVEHGNLPHPLPQI